MRDVAGSMPASSKLFSLLLTKISLNFPANFYKNINFKIALYVWARNTKLYSAAFNKYSLHISKDPILYNGERV